MYYGRTAPDMSADPLVALDVQYGCAPSVPLLLDVSARRMPPRRQTHQTGRDGYTPVAIGPTLALLGSVLAMDAT